MFVVARLLEQRNSLAPRIAQRLDEEYTVARHIVMVQEDGKPGIMRQPPDRSAPSTRHGDIDALRVATTPC